MKTSPSTLKQVMFVALGVFLWVLSALAAVTPSVYARLVKRLRLEPGVPRSATGFRIVATLVLLVVTLWLYVAVVHLLGRGSWIGGFWY